MTFLLDSIAYCIFAGLALAALAVALCVLLVPVALIRGEERYDLLTGRILVFSGFLFVWGLAGNVVWDLLVLNRLYVNPDTFAEFIPFIPAGSQTIDPLCGGHLLPGYSVFQLRLAWAAIALPVWALSLISSLGFRWPSSRRP